MHATTRPGEEATPGEEPSFSQSVALAGELLRPLILYKMFASATVDQRVAIVAIGRVSQPQNCGVVVVQQITTVLARLCPSRALGTGRE